MAVAGLFQMSPYQWTDTARLATENMKAAAQTTANMDKAKKVKSKGSGLGGILGSVVGGVAGSFIPGIGSSAGVMLGSALGGGIGGAIDGGSEGAASGLAGGLGMGVGMAGSDTFMNGMDSLWGNLGLKGSSAAGGFDIAKSVSKPSVMDWDNGYKSSIGSNIGESMALKYGPMSGLFK